MDESWTPIDSPRPPSDALVVYYVPLAKYAWGCGLDLEQIKAEYPSVTHWKVLTYAPDTH
jgi:hypothetical protein